MRALLVGLCLCLVEWAAYAQDPSLTFADQRYVKQHEDTKGSDVFVTFSLAGETDKTWTKRFLFHAFPDSGSDVAQGVGTLVKWIRQRDKRVRIGLLEKKDSNEAIVDFLLPPGTGDTVEFNVLRYAAAANGRGLVAAHYLFRFELGELDGDELKTLRVQAIEAMARFDMQAVQAYFVRPR